MFNQSKKKSIYSNLVLMTWFFLDMVGVYFQNKYLVTRSWREDGIYFLIFVISFLLFLFYEKAGKYILSCWLYIWLFAQIMSHEYITILGGGEGKTRYFEGSIKLFEIEGRYVPDLYHIILHILLFVALFNTLKYVIKKDN